MIDLIYPYHILTGTDITSLFLYLFARRKDQFLMKNKEIVCLKS